MVLMSHFRIDEILFGILDEQAFASYYDDAIFFGIIFF